MYLSILFGSMEIANVASPSWRHVYVKVNHIKLESHLLHYNTGFRLILLEELRPPQ